MFDSENKALYYHISDPRHTIEDIVGILIGERAEFSNFKKYRRLRPTTESFFVKILRSPWLKYKLR